MFDRLHDARVRGAAFDWLTSLVELHGDVLPRTVLAEGFSVDGARVPLLGPQGIQLPKDRAQWPAADGLAERWDTFLRRAKAS